MSEEVKPGDVLVIDRSSAGHDAERLPSTRHRSDRCGDGRARVSCSEHSRLSPARMGLRRSASHRVAVALAGVVSCKVDAGYGAIWPGDLLVTSPTPGHAMRTDAPLPGTMLGKALEPLEEGTGTIKILVMLR